MQKVQACSTRDNSDVCHLKIIYTSLLPIDKHSSRNSYNLPFIKAVGLPWQILYVYSAVYLGVSHIENNSCISTDTIMLFSDFTFSTTHLEKSSLLKNHAEDDSRMQIIRRLKLICIGTAANLKSCQLNSKKYSCVTKPGKSWIPQ